MKNLPEDFSYSLDNKQNPNYNIVIVNSSGVPEDGN